MRMTLLNFALGDFLVFSFGHSCKISVSSDNSLYFFGLLDHQFFESLEALGADGNNCVSDNNCSSVQCFQDVTLLSMTMVTMVLHLAMKKSWGDKTQIACLKKSQF